MVEICRAHCFGFTVEEVWRQEFGTVSLEKVVRRSEVREISVGNVVWRSESRKISL